MQAERVSARQSVVVLPLSVAEFSGSPLAADLAPTDRAACLSAALLDVLGALVRVDGVTIALVAPRDGADYAVMAGLPAGIEIVDLGLSIGTDAGRDAVLPAALRVLLDRGFGRVVAVAGDVVGPTARIVATALSSLGDADFAIGPSPGGSGYLLGVRDHQGVESLVSTGRSFGGPRFAERIGQLNLVARRIEPRARLVELSGLAALAAAVERGPEQAPRLAKFLAQLPAMDDPSPESGVVEQ